MVTNKNESAVKRMQFYVSCCTNSKLLNLCFKIEDKYNFRYYRDKLQRINANCLLS